MRHRRSGEGLLDFGELLSHRRALLAAALLLCAVTVAVGVVLFFRAPAGDHARAEQVRTTLDAYLRAVRSRQGVAACRLLTPAAQRSLLSQVRSGAAAPPSCEHYIGNPDVRDAASPTAVSPVVVVDEVDVRRATAHEQGSSLRTTLVKTSFGWRIDAWSFRPPTATVSSPTKTWMFFVVVGLFSFAIGLRGARWRWIAVVPVLFVIGGVVAKEPKGDDMPGFTVLVCIVYALSAFTLSAAGRAIRRLTRAVRH
jgi:hypothetical protein